MTWRTIDSAPKDGTWVLVYDPSLDGHPLVMPAVGVARWGVPEWGGGQETWVSVPLGPNPDTMDFVSASHWQPLPSPPEGEGE